MVAEYTGLVALWFCGGCRTVVVWPAMIGEKATPPTEACPSCRNSQYTRPGHNQRWVRLDHRKLLHGLVPE